MYSREIIAVSILMMCGCGRVAAHDLSVSSEKTQALNEAFTGQRLAELAQSQPDVDARYVYSRLLLWTSGQKLNGCFYDGSDAEKDKVAGVVAELLAYSKVNLSVDFGPRPYRTCAAGRGGSDIRVSFSQGCCSAYVGRLAHHPQVAGGPSVMLQGVTQLGAGQSRGIVAHEIMHALGFEHEHQSPDAPCDFVAESIMRRTGWGSVDYKRNISRLDHDSRSYKWSSYDNKSIMKYFYYDNELSGGKGSPCYSGENRWLSSQDVKGLQDAYPRTQPADTDRERAVLANPEAIQDASVRELVKGIKSAQEEP